MAGDIIGSCAIFVPMTGTLHAKYDRFLRERSLAMIGLLALLCLQISIASHQFEHSADDIAKSCRICVQQDRADDAPASQDVEIAAIDICISVAEFQALEISINCLADYRARAPPLS